MAGRKLELIVMTITAGLAQLNMKTLGPSKQH